LEFCPEDWWAQTYIPHIKALAEQKILSMTPVEHVLKSWIERGYILENYEDLNNKQDTKDMLTDSDTLNTLQPGGIFTPQQVPLSRSSKANDPTPLTRVYTFAHPLPKTEVYMSAVREFGAQRDFPKTSNAFFIALGQSFPQDLAAPAGYQERPVA
jgi:hypothetical protein